MRMREVADGNVVSTHRIDNPPYSERIACATNRIEIPFGIDV